MKIFKLITSMFLFLSLLNCEKDPNIPNSYLGNEDKNCYNPMIEFGVLIQKNSKLFLWGGNHDSMHFDITNWDLQVCQLEHGLGREYFRYITEPKYESISDADKHYNNSQRCIIIYSDSNPLVYSLSILPAYEIINEVIDGEPVMIAYCILADLAAVYTRVYRNQTLTFSPSGYTYHDKNVWNDISAFILWDRETESLWWPLIDEAVSGNMKGEMLEKHTPGEWEEITWKEVISNYPDAKVFKYNQY